MTPYALLAVELARIYLDFASATKTMTEEEQSLAWERMQSRVRAASDRWQAATN